MSFDLKVTIKKKGDVSGPQKKLNVLIEKIEQQKTMLAAWQNAQTEIQHYTRKKLLPLYHELHELWFQQLTQLWNVLHQHEFSKTEIAKLDEKIAQLAKRLKHSQMLNAEQLKQAIQIDTFYRQHAEHNQRKAPKELSAHAEPIQNTAHDFDPEGIAEDDFERYAADQQQAREQAKQIRQQQKREQAEQMAAQSLKTVYLKIAAIIHPDREQDETRKVEKTELFQQASQAYEQQDLFHLLKMQLQLEQNKGATSKELSSEQVKFYKLALDAQSQQLVSQIEDILNSFQLVKKLKANQVHISDVYKAIDVDAAELKQHVKWEKDCLKHMKKVSGVEMLLGSGVL
ncbi:molecular chaperone DnaJ [uncultured Acinetobacter sp.]|uniref:molecular chaperone DnaJ n=1 Tax=uncultured Acinetobacter sp. TaxID=165433 RepID=UPI00258A2EAC|nr:molecular chaperone DnaJ [uncultured Acinetobacter sp.]